MIDGLIEGRGTGGGLAVGTGNPGTRASPGEGPGKLSESGVYNFYLD